MVEPGEQIMISYNTIKTPMGGLMLVANASELIGLYFIGCDHVPAGQSQWRPDARHPILRQAKEQLREYFAGERIEFSLPLRFAGTDFQERVWRQIALIPYGKTLSYADLARKAGKPRAIRAAGTNTGRNPLSIVIPCHRVVGKNGGVGGYAGGLERKRHLLELENPGVKLSNVSHSRRKE
jgi:methylated-DNA-[protein]-cysteine S-methyltransferase